MRKFALPLIAVTIALLVIACSTEQNPVGTAGFDGDTFARKLAAYGPEAVTSASLYLYCSGPSVEQVNVHRVLSPWSDSSVTYNSFGSAFGGDIDASFTPSAMGWQSVDITARAVSWLDGSVENHGIVLDQPVLVNPQATFFSSDAAMLQPYLEICYSTPEGDSCESFPVGKDAFIDQRLPDVNYGFDDVLFVGYSDAGGIEFQSLLWFDLPVFDETSGDTSDVIDPEPDSSDVQEPDSSDVLFDCTHVAPFWARHSGCGPFKNEDLLSPMLPVWLGEPNGNQSILVDNNCTAMEYLHSRRGRNDFDAVKPLLKELLAAKLNIAAGADGSAIADVVAEVDAFLAAHYVETRRSFSREQWKNLVQWRRNLHAFNAGEIGPGRCEDSDS